MDNRAENLRLVTHSQNLRNRDIQKGSQLGITNISFNKQRGRFVVSFDIDGKRVFVGRFKTLEEAIKKRDEARQTHGY